MLAEREQGGGALVLADHGENDPAALEFPDEGLERDERLALVELAERNALETVVADHAAPKRVVQVEDHAFGDHARGREHGVEQGLGEKRKMLEPARGLRHVPHPGVEPLRTTDRGGQKVDVVQKDVLGLPRLDGQPIVDLGDSRANGIGDLEFVIAESTLTRQHERALYDCGFALGPECAPEVFQSANRLVGERPPVAAGVETRLELFARQQDDDILRGKCV